jgi:minor extracellular protease Epr
VAPDVALYVVKVLPGGYASDLLEGLQWCALNHIELVNMSLSRPEPSPALAMALDEAHARAVTVFAATGQ